MKKIIALTLALLLAFSCAGCSLFKDEPLSLAKSAWKTTDLRDDPTDVFIMHYTRRGALSDQSPPDENTVYDELPSSGYMVLFYSYKSKSFHGLEACALTESGRVSFNFNYKDSDEEYERNMASFSVYNLAAGERALECISNCNYFSGMELYAHDEAGTRPRGKLDTNTWYAFSEKDVEKIIRS